VIQRLLDKLAPRKAARGSDTGHRRLLRWAALPVTDRRWAAPLSAVALGFGLFAGVAIGPGASGTFAGGVPQVIEIPGFGASSDNGEEESEEPASAEAPAPQGESGGEESTFAPLATEAGFEVPEEEAEAPPAAGPAPEEKEPSAPGKEELAGTVVHVNAAAGSYTVAESGGVMSAVHTGKLPQAGTQVKVPIEALANGTLSEAGKRVESGKRRRATLAGIVTAVDATPSAPSYVVSNRGSSVPIHVHPDPSGTVPALPVLGAYASIAVEIETRAAASASKAGPQASASAGEPPLAEPPAPQPPETKPPPAEPIPPESAPTQPAAPAPTAVLPAAPAPSCAPDPAHPPAAIESRSVLWQRRASGGGTPFTHGDFAGIVTAICPATGQLAISADDVRESGRDLTFAVSPGLDLSKLEYGQSILVSADIAADAALTLKGLASDEHRKGADDIKAIQGDLAPAKKPKA
jgi:hypothetical protein